MENLCLMCKNSVKISGVDIFLEYTKHSKSLFITLLNHLNLSILQTTSKSFQILCRQCVLKLNIYDNALMAFKKIKDEINEIVTKSNEKFHFSNSKLSDSITQICDEFPDKDLPKFDEQSNCVYIKCEDYSIVDNEYDEKQSKKAIDPAKNTNKIKEKDYKNKNFSNNFTYECDECDKKFNQKYNFNRHRLTHKEKKNDIDTECCLKNITSKNTSPDNFACKECEFIGISKKTLIRHQRTRSHGLEKFKCHLCEKSFIEKSSLNRHFPVHTGEKRFQCDKCGKNYREHSSFRMHQLAHDNVRTKECPTCGFKFSTTSHLKRHILIHTGEKPHTCPICNRTFAQRYNMQCHLKQYCNKKNLIKS